MPSILLSQFHHGQDGCYRNALTLVVIHIHVELYDSLSDVIIGAFLLFDLFLNREPDPNGGARIYRLRKASFLDAVVEQYRTLFGIDEQSRCFAQQIVSMSYSLLKYGAVETRFIYMSVKVITAYIGKIDNVGFGDGVLRCCDRVAND